MESWGPAVLVTVSFALAALAGCVGSISPVEFDNDGDSLHPLDDPVCTGMVGGVDIRTATIADLQQAMGEPGPKVTSVKLVEAYIARILAFDNGTEDGTLLLNAVRQISPTALEHAAQLDAERKAGSIRGPLHGIPFMMKDNIGTHDQPTTAGAVALGNNVPPRDATLVAKLRDAGAIVLGKNELGELANWGAARNGSSMGGNSTNAYNGGSPAGSSSGPGVAASMAFGAVALGSETSGSILGPTNVNSLAGLKTSHGLVSGKGVVPIAYHFDVVGPMGRNVHDLALMLDAMAGTDPEDPFTADADANVPPGGYASMLSTDALQGIRLGYDPETETNPLFLAALEDLEALGAELVELPGATGLTAGGAPEFASLPNAFHHDFNFYLQNDANPDLPFENLREFLVYNQQNYPEPYTPPPPLTWASALTPGDRTLRDVSAEAAIASSRAVADALLAMGGGVDAVISAGAAFSLLGASAGYPTAMAPMGYDGQDPIGLAFFGPRWSDGEMMAYAYAYEQATMNRIIPEEFNPALVADLCPDDGTPGRGPPAGGGGRAGGAWQFQGVLDAVDEGRAVGVPTA